MRTCWPSAAAITNAAMCSRYAQLCRAGACATHLSLRTPHLRPRRPVPCDSAVLIVRDLLNQASDAANVTFAINSGQELVPAIAGAPLTATAGGPPAVLDAGASICLNVRHAEPAAWRGCRRLAIV